VAQPGLPKQAVLVRKKRDASDSRLTARRQRPSVLYPRQTTNLSPTNRPQPTPTKQTRAAAIAADLRALEGGMRAKSMTASP
ncbi:MAG: hypothetical protein ACK441_07850, partial [Burkholderiales bacterium]